MLTPRREATRTGGLSRGITLIEILAALAVVAALLGILTPVLGSLRAAAQNAGCSQQQRNLHMAAMHFATSRKEILPGVNTTGRKYLFGGPETVLEMIGDSAPRTPVQTFDWISPIMGLSAGLSSNRARRTKQIFEDLGCPAAWADNKALYGNAPDRDTDFRPLLEQEGIGQISYLAPGPFHLLGRLDPSSGPQGKHFGWRGPAVPPTRYLPRLDRVGTQLSEKIFCADGTRYLPSSGVLDFDVNPRPIYYGSFTSSTPIYDGSTAYGRSEHAPDYNEGRPSRSMYPANRNLSYRHGKRMNVVYFDGHVASLTEEESKRDAAPWYPTGSEFTGDKATEESLAHHDIGEILR